MTKTSAFLFRGFFFMMLFFVCRITLSQITVINQKGYGGNDYEFLFNVKRAGSNQFFFAGSSSSGISGNKTEPCRGELDYWVIRTDSNLNITWQKTIGGSAYDMLSDVLPVNDTLLYLFGYSNTGISGDKTDSGFGSEDFWLVALNPQTSQILWQRSFGGSAGDAFGTNILLLSDGGMIVAGSSQSDSSGWKSENCRGVQDYWIVRIDGQGNKVWDKTCGGADVERASNITFLGDSTILISGYSWSGVSGEKTEQGYGNGDIWLVCLNLQGQILWDKTIGGSGTDMIGSVVTHNHSIYLGIESGSGVSGMKTEPCFGLSDYWVVKLDGAGNKIWDRTFGGDNWDYVRSMYYSPNHTLMVLGHSVSGISGNKKEVCRGGSDYWIVVLDTNGNESWQKTIGGDNGDGTPFIFEKSNNRYIIAGSSSSGISGDKTMPSRGLSDFWIVEIDTQTGIGEPFPVSEEFYVYPNPTAGVCHIGSAQPNRNLQVKVFNMQGQLLITETVNSGAHELDLANLPAGCYLLSLLGDDGSACMKKVVKY